jgi:heat shock protein HtpX
MPSVSARTIASIPALFVGLVVLVALAAIDLIVALVAAVALAGLTLVLVQRTATNRVLSALNAAQLEEGVESRLESLVESICASHGINEPGLYVAKTTAMDAAVVGRSDDTRLVVTQGLLDRLDRLELESVVARQLSMFGSGVFAGTVLASVGGLLGPLGGRLRAQLLDGRRFVIADFDAVGVTRYPPALASAFSKALERARVTHRAASDHLWMIGSGTDPVQPSLGERVDALLEL